jgi:hypothetical protein
MTTPQQETPRATKRSNIGLTAAAAVACAVCCAGPIIGVLAAIGLTTGLAAIAIPALAVVAVAAIGAALLLRRRARARCAPQRFSDIEIWAVRPPDVPAEKTASG